MAARTDENYDEWVFGPHQIDPQRLVQQASEITSGYGAQQAVIVAALVSGQYQLEAADRIAHAIERLETSVREVGEALSDYAGTVEQGIKTPDIADGLSGLAEAFEGIVQSVDVIGEAMRGPPKPPRRTP
jgi:HAMP domain-containing protein